MGRRLEGCDMKRRNPLIIDLATITEPPRGSLEPESAEDRQKRVIWGLTLIALTGMTCLAILTSGLDLHATAAVVMPYMALLQRDLQRLNLARNHRELIQALRRAWRPSSQDQDTASLVWHLAKVQRLFQWRIRLSVVVLPGVTAMAGVGISWSCLAGWPTGICVSLSAAAMLAVYVLDERLERLLAALCAEPRLDMAA